MRRGGAILFWWGKILPTATKSLSVSVCSSQVSRFIWTVSVGSSVSAHQLDELNRLHWILRQRSPVLRHTEQATLLQRSIMDSFPFCAEYDKRGAAKCKKCKQKCEKGVLRIGKLVNNPFTDSGGMMKQWHHVDCIFETFKRARATTKKIEDPVDDIEGWEALEEDDKQKIRDLIDEYQNNVAQKTTPKKQTPQKKATNQTPQKKDTNQTPQKKTTQQSPGTPFGFKKNNAAPPSPPGDTSRPSRPVDPSIDRNHKDNSFREFRRICALVADEPSYTGKTEIVSNFFKYGTSKDKFQGDLRLWVKLLLPGVIKRVYNLQSKQLVKLFSQIFNTNQELMIEDLELGDVAETIRKFFEESSVLPPIKKSVLSIQDVDEYLEELTGMTKEEEQSIMLKRISKKCTGNDLKMVVRLIKGDLRINAGAKHILDAVHSDAYEAFQTTRNIDAVLDKVIEAGGSDVSLKMTAQLMTPVLPMLAEACKSVDYAFKKCPSGAMFAEIKYDGERVQVHKEGGNFKYFSRSLKPVLPHKVSHFKDYLPEAFPHGRDMILDSEVLMIDTKTSVPLPFGTLGVHKKAAFKDATVCLFIFDCLHYNGEDLMSKPMSKRREILEETITEIKHHVQLSEQRLIRQKSDLKEMIDTVLKQGLEGLVLKDINSIYEPGKRHWLKVKKDYLNDGAMADTADLVVLGAWYGTGKKGGMMSVFLMGCYDPRINKFCTVTKVHTGHDDAALERLQETLDMTKISQDPDRVPSWLKCTKTMIPDFVATDPKLCLSSEIAGVGNHGAEFTKHQVHTADGISIRFPRVTCVRDDKTWKEATSLPELQELFKKSQEHADFVGLEGDTNSNSSGNSNGERLGDGSGGGRDSPSPNKGHRGKLAASSDSTPNKEKPKKENKGDNSLRRKKPETEDDSPLPKKKQENKGDSSLKRKQPEMEDDSPVPKKKVCRFGEKCSNTNEAHQLLYDHPSRTTLKAPTVNPLPDIFVGVSVYLPESLDPARTLQRYLIAFVDHQKKAPPTTHTQ